MKQKFQEYHVAPAGLQEMCELLTVEFSELKMYDFNIIGSIYRSVLSCTIVYLKYLIFWNSKEEEEREMYKYKQYNKVF